MVSPIALSPCECISSSRLFAESLRVHILERRPRRPILVLGIGLLVQLPRLGGRSCLIALWKIQHQRRARSVRCQQGP